MTESDSLNELFSSLSPISYTKHSEAATAERIFTLKVSDGQPFIEAQENLDTRNMSADTLRLYNEVSRLADSDDLFGINESVGYDYIVSLWENPHLVNFLTENNSIKLEDNSPLLVSDSSASLCLEITESNDSPTAAIRLTVNSGDAETLVTSFLDDTHVLAADTVYTVKSIGPNYTHAKSLAVPMRKERLEAFLTLFLTYVENITPVLNGVPARISANTEQAIPTLFLEKVASDKALYLRTGSSLESLADTLPPGLTPTRVAHVGGNKQIVIRNVEGCDIKEKTDSLEKLILNSSPNRQARKEVYRDDNFFIVPEESAGPFLLHSLPAVLETFKVVGSDKLKEYKVLAVKPKLNMSFSSGIDFLEGEGDVEIGGEHFSIADILNQYSRKKYIQLSDGNRGIIDEDYVHRLQRLFRRRDKNGRIKVTVFDLPDVEEMLNAKVTGEFARHSREVLEGFNNLAGEQDPELKVNATLRPYQKEGVKWLRYLYDNKLGGCLADDMGLGKTLQTIAMLAMIYPAEKQPSLIVMPRSLLFNWEKELDRFAPQITHHTYYGSDRDLDKALQANVVLTTYALVRNDITKLKEQRFNYVILDESQNIKNTQAQTTVAVQVLNGDHRLALSGTPMENNLTEIYSLFRFLNPPMFGSADDFNASYTLPIQKYGDKDATESLRRRIFPFILRRLKKDVLNDLPDRIDQTIYVEMSDEQKRLYDNRRNSYRRQISEAIAKEGVHKSQFLMFQALSELRRIASVPESLSDGTVSSPKIDELLESLSSSVSNGHKAVVFFNFIAGLEIVMERLEKMGIEFESMTGSTSAASRKKIVERFQSDPSCMVMLLTLKVGGVGLNLTAADTVYIFEPWWNKAAEEQAINRLHRIGQKSTVSSFSIITVGTIEEKILQLQQQKSELFNELISADTASSKHLSEKDIDFILS